MNTSKTKKALSLVLAFIMLFTMIPTTVFTLASDENLPVMEAYNAASSGDYHKYYNRVCSVTFLDKIDYTDISSADTLYSWDVSANKDASVMAWMKKNTDASAAAGADRYDVYIGGEGGVKANPDSSYIFYCFSALKEVNGLENFKTDDVTTFFRLFEKCTSLTSLDLSSFDTSKATNFSYMFSECKALTEINLNGWNTAQATTMAYMFNNCQTLTLLDISSFDTKNVTNMKHMFYKCMELNPIYAGPDWSVSQVIDDGEMFNCCYAVVGGKEKYDLDFQYISPTKEYAKFKEDGGFLTYKAPESPEEYKVTYEFLGSIPEGVTAPSEAVYKEGTSVTVADIPSADGYIFNGWVTEDATITDNSFTVNNDVRITGTWIKLYKVTYFYDEDFDVPVGAPELPEAVYYKAGDEVDVLGIPYVYRHLFVGWTTDDADTAGGMFIMPENDVELYGYFKIPVESIEIMDSDISVNINDPDDKPTINVFVNPEDATIKDISYESSDESIVSFDKYGRIIAHKEGTVTVTIKSADDPTKSDTIEVTVKGFVTEITVDKSEILLNKGDTGKITGTVNEDATVKDVKYESANESVAKVDENGNITPVGEGTTTITVSSKDNPSIKKEVTVTVKNPVTELIAPEDFTLDAGEEKLLEVKINSDATNKELIYETNNPGVAKIDVNGNVIAVGKGEAVITVISKDDPSKTDTVTVTVKQPVEGIIIPEETITLNEGEEKEIGATVTPENADYGLIYESSNPDIAEVTDDGKIIAKSEGEVTITVKSEDGKAEEKVTVTVKKPVVFVEDIVVTVDKTTLEIGDEAEITATVTPDNATNKNVTFESSNPDIAEVTDDGKIIAKSEGEVTITVKSEDGKAEEKVTVTVKIPVEQITATVEKTELEVGETVKIITATTPDNATNKEVTYGYYDENVIRIDKDGNITAVGEGETFIHIKSVDNSSAATVIKITVKPAKVPVTEITADKTELTLEKGDTDKITVTVTPDNATEKGLIYESSNDSIVTVDENGNITATGEGEAIITVTSKDNPEKKISVKVKVTLAEDPTDPEVPEEPEEPTEPEKPEYTIEVPDGINIFKGEKKPLGIVITPDDGSIVPTFKSSDESVVKIDADGNITGVGVGVAVITADFGGGDIRLIPVTVLTVPVKHHVCFGKTDGIGWYEVSVNGGDFFPQGPNSTLEVTEGSILVIRVQDMWIDDEFDFYVNGKKVPLDPANTITVVVDGYMLIGALSMDVPVPDAEESVSLFKKVLNAISDFFAMIKNFFKKIFS